MDRPHLGPLPRFTTIGLAEQVNLKKAMKAPLSGYLGGIDKAGYFVTKLQNDWCDTFNVKHAVACNSATSGLLAACMALGIGPGDTVWTSAYTMSATAACAKVLGATIAFIDIETVRYSMNMNQFRAPFPKCIIVTNLFGHPAYLAAMRSWCDSNKVWMIEDNAQAPFAREGNKYAGTIGHIGVFSFNVHKHLQCGEGGIVVTDDNATAEALQRAINHGELSHRGSQYSNYLGLNLRMTEPTAAIACAQLTKAEKIIAGRIALAEELTYMVKDIPWMTPMIPDIGCKHVYYKWVARITNGWRNTFVKKLQNDGFPMIAGYSAPLHRIFKTKDFCPIVANLEDCEIICFDICAYSPRKGQLNKMREIINWAAGSMQ